MFKSYYIVYLRPNGELTPLTLCDNCTVLASFPDEERAAKYLETVAVPNRRYLILPGYYKFK